ncbi:hypothetical protein Q3G72_004715 [Acer saccharum]|nr:hypothetical protein Q3G72_004715 [Acer saccharum]
MSRFRSPPELSKFESPGFKSLQMLSNGPFVFRQRKVCIEGLKQCFGEFASQSSENSTYMSKTSNGDSDTNNLVNTWDGIAAVDEPELESMKVSRKLEFLSPAKAVFLEYLCIKRSCDSLRFLPLVLFPKLRSLTLWDCADFSCILITKDHISIQKLQILDCPKLSSFPNGGLRTPILSTLLLFNCKNLKSLPDQLHKLTSLLRLDIKECPELESIPEGGLPCKLNFIRISSCDKLTPQTEWGMLKLRNLDYFEIEGGWVGYFSYDTDCYVEKKRLPFEKATHDDRHLADIHQGLYDNVIVYDHVEKVPFF